MAKQGFTPQQKRAELERFLTSSGSFGEKHYKFSKAILHVLGEESLKIPEREVPFSASVLSQLLSKLPVPVSLKPDKIPLEVSHLRTVLHREYAKSGKRPGDICITFPKLHDRSSGAYRIEFHPFPQDYKLTPEARLSVLNKEVNDFWKQVFYGFGSAPGNVRQRDALLIFSNEPPTYLEENNDPRGLISGSGEVMAAWELCQTLSLMNLHAEPLRSRHAATHPRFRAHDTVLIFLGSELSMKCQSDLLKEEQLRAQQDYFFKWPKARVSGKQDGQIVSTQNEKFVCTPPLKGFPERQYALISLLHGALSNQTVLCMGGLSSLGTEAATQFLCHNSTVHEIFTHLGGPGNRMLKPFQVVIEATIHSDVAGSSTPVGWYPSKKTLAAAH